MIQPPHNPNGHPGTRSRSDPEIHITFRYRLRHTRDVFEPANTTLRSVLDPSTSAPHQAAAVIDQSVAEAWPNLIPQLERFIAASGDHFHRDVPALMIPGGEPCKNDLSTLKRIVAFLNEHGLCRHSYLLAIGGGAALDVAGFAASTVHRGIRIIRIPTTTLAQGDAGIGVKNGINCFGKKNFLGTFAVPWAVINDETFLTTLSDRDWRCGISEAVKVALVKDCAFFKRIEQLTPRLAEREQDAGREFIQRSAELHLQHIVEGGDPFELTAARPLDFGHWSAHKLEQLSGYEIRHGEAVAIGIALDVLYCRRIGMLDERDAQRVLACLSAVGFDLFDQRINDSDALIEGFDEFREHLGGRLTIALINRIGRQVDVHEIDHDAIRFAIDDLAERATALAAARGEG